jgi:hypothetical protein
MMYVRVVGEGAWGSWDRIRALNTHNTMPRGLPCRMLWLTPVSCTCSNMPPRGLELNKPRIE